MEKKIVFFDIDGTIMAPECKVTEKVKDAIDSARKKGVLCFIASGRPIGFVADNVKEVGFDGYVLANGANIKYMDKDLQVRNLDFNYLKELIQKLKKQNIEYVLQTNTYCYFPENNENLHNYYKRWNIDFKNFRYDFDEDEVLKRTVKIEAWMNDEKEYQFVLNNINHFYYDVSPEKTSIEIYSSTVSKGTGINDVFELLKIKKENSYCFGDGSNDKEMFETVGHPIAMGNAIEELKEKAEQVCLSVYEDGVAYKLEELFE